MNPYRCFGRRNANREGGAGDPPHLSDITPIFPAEAVVPFATRKQDHKPAVVAERPDHDPKFVDLDWDSSSSDAGVYHASSPSHQRLPGPWISSSTPPPSPPDSKVLTTPPVNLPPGIQPPPASFAESSFPNFRPVDCSLPLRVDDAFATCQDNDSDWADAWQAGPSCPANRRETLLAHIYSEHESGPLRSQPPTHRSVVPVLRQDQRNRRPSDRPQLLYWNPGPARGSDPSLLARHLNGP